MNRKGGYVAHSVERDRPHIFRGLGKWMCTIDDYIFGTGDTPKQAYDNYWDRLRVYIDGERRL